MGARQYFFFLNEIAFLSKNHSTLSPSPNITLQNWRLKNRATFRGPIVCRCLIWSPSPQSTAIGIQSPGWSCSREDSHPRNQGSYSLCRLILRECCKMITGMPYLPFARSSSINRGNADCFCMERRLPRSQERTIPFPLSFAFMNSSSMASPLPSDTQQHTWPQHCVTHYCQTRTDTPVTADQINPISHRHLTWLQGDLLSPSSKNLMLLDTG